MRFSTSTLLALLASLAAAASLDTPEASNLNTTTASDLTPAVERDSDILGGDAVGLSLEGLAPCYAQCMIDQNTYYHTNLAQFTFRQACGFYWVGFHSWEWARVRGCALLHCMDWVRPVQTRTCNVPRWIYEAHRTWLIEHCKGIRDIARYPERPSWMDPY
ncbi:hypothetical protein NKR19_g32 [Coniochaeta hoffmannii]|uniref:Cyanovirin-N domain-containing protein n=1 Tax=Coniochaeta hoffmannii TaxID=91930 RepID=A0AA38SL08_9PEZI|nr:hypothetical protein NKR19_g32 [Coniochaeta hoffmannii]